MSSLKNIEGFWKDFNYSGINEYEFSRFDKGESIPELNIGLNSKFNRCLLLELPLDYKADFLTIVKENLTLSYFEDTNYIVLELTNNAYYDLFNDLILSIYQRVYKIDDTSKYVNTFLEVFYKWSEFFEDQNSNKHSYDVIKGLWGELFFLKSLITEGESRYLNEILLSWKGPYDKGHDFESEDKSIEVKTKDISKQTVRISSEYQLENEYEKSLELVVLSVEDNYIEGMSLSQLLFETKSLIQRKLGDFSIVLDALRQKNITSQNIENYDNFKFLEKEELVYLCDEKFPRLSKSTIPESISSVSYNLNLKSLKSFILSERVFNDRD